MSANLFGNFLTVATIPLLILLLIIYYSKDQFNNIRSKLFKSLLYVLLVGSITEVIWALSMNYDAPQFALEIISRTHFILLAAWWLCFIFYLIALFNGHTFNNFKELFTHNLATKILSVYSILACLSIAVVPQFSTVQDININKMEYMPTKVLIISIFVICLAGIIAIYYLIKNKNNKNTEGDKVVLYVVIVGIVLYFSIQSLFTYVSLPSIFLTVFV
jgi:hypothetical protein